MGRLAVQQVDDWPFDIQVGGFDALLMIELSNSFVQERRLQTIYDRSRRSVNIRDMTFSPPVRQPTLAFASPKPTLRTTLRT